MRRAQPPTSHHATNPDTCDVQSLHPTPTLTTPTHPHHPHPPHPPHQTPHTLPTPTPEPLQVHHVEGRDVVGLALHSTHSRRHSMCAGRLACQVSIGLQKFLTVTAGWPARSTLLRHPFSTTAPHTTPLPHRTPVTSSSPLQVVQPEASPQTPTHPTHSTHRISTAPPHTVFPPHHPKKPTCRWSSQKPVSVSHPHPT